MDQGKDYPEHLNPFKTRTGGIRGSFRQLKSTLSKTFRKKDKESKAEIRRNGAAGVSSQNRQTVSVALRHPDQSQINTTPALPRSRFSERVAKAQTYNADSTEVTNPFGEVAPPRRHRTTMSETEGEGTLRRHRGKKRAPLPPHRRGENGLLGIPDGQGSKWSVNSGDTDISSSNYTYCSETDLEMEHDDNLETVKEFQDITKEIQNLTENDTEIVKRTDSKMPDLVASTEVDVTHHHDCKLAENDSNNEVIDTNKEGIDTNNAVINTNNEVINISNEVITTNNEVITPNNEVIDTDNEVIDTNNRVIVIVTKAIDTTCIVTDSDHVIETDTNIIDTNKGSDTKVIDGDTVVIHDVNEICDNSQENGENNKAEIREDINDIQANEECKIIGTSESTKITKEISEEKTSPNKIIEDAINDLENFNISQSRNAKLNETENIDEYLYVDEDIELEAIDASENIDYQNNNYSVKETMKKFEPNPETNYRQVKSLYIGGSRDALENPLNYKERKSIYITGSCDNLLENKDNNNEKIRKHIITTEEALLGVANNK